jgi:nicotinamidase-related amidase
MDRFTLDSGDALLMIVDIQERLAAAMEAGKEVIQKTGILLEMSGVLSMPVVFTEQYPKGLGKTVPELRPDPERHAVFEKLSFSAYTEELAAFLMEAGRKKIILAGMETHVCVFQTARDLLDAGYQVFAARDAVCSRARENRKNGLRLLADMGAVVTNTESIVFDLIKKAGTPEFKTASRLIK